MGIACWKSAGIWVCTTPRSAKSSNRQSHKLIIQDLTACLSLWNRAEFALAKNRRLFLSDQQVESPSLLKGLIFDDAGNRMSRVMAARESGATATTSAKPSFSIEKRKQAVCRGSRPTTWRNW